LRDSEESRATGVEAAELGTWRSGFGADRFDGSARCRAMPPLPAALGP
jgi:hypothetical protein